MSLNILSKNNHRTIMMSMHLTVYMNTISMFEAWFEYLYTKFTPVQ